MIGPLPWHPYLLIGGCHSRPIARCPLPGKGHQKRKPARKNTLRCRSPGRPIEQKSRGQPTASLASPPPGTTVHLSDVPLRPSCCTLCLTETARVWARV
jgi:hypothetical protein